MSNILRIPPRRPPHTYSNVDPLDMPQIMTINQVPAPSSEPDLEEEYVTDEEEVDEIIDDEPPPPSRKTNGKGKAKANSSDLTPGATPGAEQVSPQKTKLEKSVPPLSPRKPGETHVDQKRVEKIIKAHGDMLPPSRDAVFLITLAAEEFVKRLAGTGHRFSLQDEHPSIEQRDIALAAQMDRGYSFLRETVPVAIPLSIALQKHAQKENERTLIATELTHPSTVVGNGTTYPHKKRQQPLPKPSTGVASGKGKTRTSARQANGRSSNANASAVSSSTSASATPLPVTTSPRPKRAAAQKGRNSWVQADDEDDDGMEYDEAEDNFTPPMDVDADDTAIPWRAPARHSFGAGGGASGVVKGFGPGTYGKVASITGRPSSGSPPRSRSSPWGFPPEPPRNTGRTIYSDRKDEEARKAAVEAEEQLRYKRARQKIEQELMTQEVHQPLPEWTDKNRS